MLFFFVEAELFLFYSGNSAIGRHLMFAFIPVILAIIPSNFLFLSSLSKKLLLSSNKRVWIHYLIPGLVFLICAPLYGIMVFGNEAGIYYDKVCDIFWGVVLFSLETLFLVQAICYLILLIIVYFQHKKQVKTIYSYEEGVNLKWMALSIVGYILFTSSIILTELTELKNIKLIENTIVLIYLFFIQFFGLRQLAVNTKILKSKEQKPLTETNKKEAKEVKDKSKYGSSALNNPEKIKEILDKLIQYIEKDKAYLDPQLTVYTVASNLRINQKYISQVIHTEMGTNFISLINKYRIEEAKRIIAEDKSRNYTIEGIGQMAGFNSRATFYKTFRKFCGKTPAEFRKELF